uniref:non-specific serine/threonine protein kinase n=1 Tax=Cuerna arida TaxID=1464854 RepID=A0A1B6ELH4_9HEMI
MASKAKKPRKVNGYKMPAPIPAGYIVKNSQKKSWEVGSSIGKGGFGEIYCCTPIDDAATSKTKSKSYPHVMKIEPQENGPLFVEMHFYMKVAKKEDIENWMKSKGIKRLGMPCYLGSGSFEYNKERYRFVVMDRYGQDIWSKFLENKKVFPCATALKIGLQVLDVLEYIHDQGYAHCDVKGANLLLGTQKGTEDQVYLVDFGLAARYITTEFKPDPKKAHNGTIEYTSRDAHLGVTTRRGDMEILGFNLLHWVTSTLPWDNITDPKVVEEKKIALMKSISSARKLIPSAPTVITSYLDYVSKLKHDEAPNYDFCRKLFKDELKKLGVANTGKLVFKADKTPKKATAAAADADSEVPGRVRRRRVAVNFSNGHDSDSAVDIGDDDESPPPTPKKTPRKTKKDGPSWKDCETAKASNVVRAGEYISSKPKATKRQRNE